MRVKGMGWEQFKHAWSKDNRKYSVFELAKHLTYIVREEKKLTVPDEPPLIAPQRVSLGVLGTQSSQVQLWMRSICLTSLTSGRKQNRLVGSVRIEARVACILSCSRLVARI